MLDEAARKRFEDLVAQFKALGAPDPESWAQSEVQENFAQLACFCFLRGLWRNLIDAWSDSRWIQGFIDLSEREPASPYADVGVALKRLMAGGARAEDIQRVARAVAYDVVFGVLEHLDEGYDPDAGEGYPGWELIEIGRDGHPTGRGLQGLHESLLQADPSGREGRPSQQ